jgi:trk system potassium uptake protein TrkH
MKKPLSLTLPQPSEWSHCPQVSACAKRNQLGFMFDFRPILFVNGVLLIIVSLVMLLPALVDIAVGHDDWKVFATSSMATGFIGVTLFLTNRGYIGSLNLRQAFLFTTLSYLIISFFASMPLYLADGNMHAVDAFFETVSGVTSTGASVMSNLDVAPPGILLWRSLLNGLGGVGIVVLTLAVLPTLQIGGMQLFRTESSDNMEKALPRTTQIAGVISTIFGVLTLLCAFAYWVAGMNGFDAICHALTTVATGGFSTHDQSIGFYNSVTIELIAMFFMIAGALPLMLYYKALRGNKSLYYDTQVRFFFKILLLVVALLTFWLVETQGYSWLDALRFASFNVVSIITTTGYSSANFSAWGTFAIVLFFMLIVVGGCTGSTAGGIKIFRFQVLFEIAKAQIAKLLQPHGVFIPRFNNKEVSPEAASSVMTFFLLFAFSFMLITLLLSAFGLDFLTAMSATAQALANVGQGLGDIVGPAGNYSTLPDGAKWILCFTMIMGRLEIMTVIVLFSKRFWRD